MHIEVPFGKGVLDFIVPDQNLLGVIKPPAVSTLDPKEAIRAALAQPIGSPRLREMARPGQKAVIVPTDITRSLHEEIILPLLLEELNAAGIPDGDITLVIANGTHRPDTREECVAMYGEEVVKRVRIVNHSAYEEAGLKYLGQTPSRGIPVKVNKIVAEADLKIATGVIEPHLFAGYSGGVKSIAVGVAGAETIAATHNVDILDDPRTRLGVIEGNVFRQFLEEATRFVHLDFVVNVVLTPEKEFVRVVAGDPVAAHAEGVRTARQVYEVAVDRPADIVIAAPGYPKDRDLYQATRAVNTSVYGPKPLVKQGGVLIIPAPCPDGIGHEGYHSWMRTVHSADEAVAKAKAEGFAPGEHKVFVLARILQQAELMIVGSAVPERTLRELLLTPVKTMEQALARALARLGPEASVWVLPYGVITIPVVS
ncbi:MAG TPA: nickel-dependent lactate racemase [Firmicutes bacterium]|nr:nickel-dependent lactate racemase [Bacillota bacterium]